MAGVYVYMCDRMAVHQGFVLCCCLGSSFKQLRVAADKPEFTTDKPGGGGIPGSKARVLERLREHGWEDAIQVKQQTRATFFLTVTRRYTQRGSHGKQQYLCVCPVHPPPRVKYPVSLCACVNRRLKTPTSQPSTSVPPGTGCL